MMKFVCRSLALALTLFCVSAIADLEEAQSLYERGRTADALAEVERLLEERPSDAQIRFLQGIIYAEMGRNSDAIEVFAGLTTDYPELPEPWNNLAVLFAENGEFDKAREALLAAIQTHPSYSTAHENLGDLYARMAGMAYDRALEQDRGNESARLKLSAVNGLFSVPQSTAPTQVAAVSQPAPVVREPEPEPEPVVTEPEPEPVVAEAEPEPVVAEPEPEPVVTEPEPEPVVVAVADPEPAAEPEPAVSVPDTQPAVFTDPSGAIETIVRGWAKAWSDQNVDGYLDSYDSSFRPSNGASRASWVRYRRERLTKPSFIQVDISDLNIDVVDANTARAEFTQRYQSDNYEDQVRKTLTLTRSGDSWRIASEVSGS